jgi:hypothetical protein
VGSFLQIWQHCTQVGSVRFSNFGFAFFVLQLWVGFVFAISARFLGISWVSTESSPLR